MIATAGIRIADLGLAHRRRRLSVGLHSPPGVRGVRCSRKRYRPRNCSIDSSAGAEVSVHLVGLMVTTTCFLESLRDAGGGDPFGGGQQFVFNLGGGPGFRVHQFGGGRPQRRPRDANGAETDRPSSASSMLLNLLPLLILFVFPLLSSLLASSPPPGPDLYDSPDPPHSMKRTSKPRALYTYYVDPNEVPDYRSKDWLELDKQVEIKYINQLQFECSREQQVQNKMVQDAQGFFFPDKDKLAKAKRFEKKSCDKLRGHGIAREYY